MPGTAASNLTIKIAQSINEISKQEWDRLSADRPFQSHRWYQFGEHVMNDSRPTYLLACRGDEIIGRAALWKIKNEPLPLSPGIGRAITESTLRRRPLLICRSPLSSTSGLILPDGPFRAEALHALSGAALDDSQQGGCLALIFDFLGREECEGWQNEFTPFKLEDPGTILQNRWSNLEAYLEDGNKKDRQHYKRTLREAEKLGIRIESHDKVPDIPAALELIRNMDRRHGNSPNPWMQSLLENLEMAQGTWLEATQNGKLVGCGALLEDREIQLTTALGLAEDVPFVYLLLAYASLENAIQKNIRALRWGSGAYEVKKNLGFELEDNDYIVVSSANIVLRTLLKALR